MRNADTATRAADVSRPPAGTGQAVTFKCDKCLQIFGTTLGRKQIKRGGLNLGWLCRGCA